MRPRPRMRLLAALAAGLGVGVGVGLGLVARNDPPDDRAASQQHAVFGASPPARSVASAPLLDAGGHAIPPAPSPPGTRPLVARTGPMSAVALWERQGRIMGSTYATATGWTAMPQPLEDIFGEASEPRLVGNGHGLAVAVWRHTVGRIESLRSSVFERGAWSTPDVVPGALPATEPGRPGLRLDVSPLGHVTATWPSGFAEGQWQAAHFVPGQGWSPAEEGPALDAAASPYLR